MAEIDLLARARRGDAAAFERLVEEHRRPLHAHCYRMLGSLQDAEDALQETLVGAWRGLAGFEGRSSLRTWLYRIATHACLRLAARRPGGRVLSPDRGPARHDVDDLGEPVSGSVWLEPYPDPPAGPGADPAEWAERRESVELAFVAALAHLAPRPRAVLLLREVLCFPAAEVAGMLDTTVPAVNSALQRARAAVDVRATAGDQAAELRRLGPGGRRDLVAAFVAAWERADVPALLALLTEDARFAMPPLPGWFAGRADIGRFASERMFATPWRLRPIGANGQLAFACYQGPAEGEGPFRLGAINVVTLRAGRVAAMTGFLDPALRPWFGLPAMSFAAAPSQ
jgi:RNA polymerase sigma-70 factor (TIGR02960 family)